MPKKQQKKEPMFDESPKIPQEKIDEESDDLLRLSLASIRRRYTAICRKYGRDVRSGRMSPTEAHTRAMCEVISENNTNLLTLIEHQFEIKFLT